MTAPAADAGRAGMAGHTPGPWHVCTNKVGYPYQIRASFADEDKPGGLVDITRWASLSMPSSAEGQANARLIAAAPEMLADLMDAAAQFRFYEQQHRAKGTPDAGAKAEVNRAMAERLEATIQKARGA